MALLWHSHLSTTVRTLYSTWYEQVLKLFRNRRTTTILVLLYYYLPSDILAEFNRKTTTIILLVLAEFNRRHGIVALPYNVHYSLPGTIRFSPSAAGDIPTSAIAMAYHFWCYCYRNRHGALRNWFWCLTSCIPQISLLNVFSDIVSNYGEWKTGSPFICDTKCMLPHVCSVMTVVWQC